jgi:transposase
MGQPLSMDLRARLIAAIDDGMSCRAAAARFGVAPSTAIRWHAQRRDVGHFKPKAQGGDMRSHHVEKRATDILALWEAIHRQHIGGPSADGRRDHDAQHSLDPGKGPS